MAITGAYGTNNGGITTSISLPRISVDGDLIVIALGSGNANWTTVTASGAGATWYTFGTNSGGAAQGNWFAIGVNAGAGYLSSAVTLSSNPSTTAGSYSIAMFSGCSKSFVPTAAFGPLTNTTFGSTVTATGLSWSSGELLLAVGEAYTWASTTPTGTWAGASDTFIGSSIVNSRAPFINYQIASSSGSSATYVSPASASGYGVGTVYGFIIPAAATAGGNMLLAMN